MSAPPAPLTVAFQGEAGAYSEQAVYELLGAGGRFQAVGYSSFDDAFAATQSGAADFLLAPIENTLGGTIHANCDLQLRHDLCIVGEYNLRVRHNLMALPGTVLGDVTKAISHPQALAQCDAYLRGKGIVAESQYDTAGSAKMIAAGQLRGVAAVASVLAAKHYGLEILDSGIEDDSNNFTRFLLLRKEPIRLPPAIDAKTSIVFSMKDNVAGALFKALSVFALRDIDLSKIESRPCKPNLLEELRHGRASAASSPSTSSSSASSSSSSSSGGAADGSSVSDGKHVWMSPVRGSGSAPSSSSSSSSASSPSAVVRRRANAVPSNRFKYLFYADLLAPLDDPNTANALRHLQEITSFFRVLGTYARDGVLVGLGPAVPDSPTNRPGARGPASGGGGMPPDLALEAAVLAPRRQRVGIVGFGNFGQFLAAKLLSEYDVFAHSRSDYSVVAAAMGVSWHTTLEHLVAQDLDVVIVATSILSFQAVVRALSDALASPALPAPSCADVLVVDVLSVKCHAKTTMLALLPDGADVLCTHPMFGPESGKHGWSGLPFVYERVRLRDARRCEDFLRWWSAQGCRMEDMTCELHDSCAAGSQFVTHFTGRVLARLSLRTTPINTRGFDSLLQLVDNTCKDSFDLFFALYKFNPNSEAQLRVFEQALADVAATLRATPPTTVGSPQLLPASQKSGSPTSPATAEAAASMARLNPRVASLAPSATVALYDKTMELQRQGRSIIGLNVGQPDYLPHETVLLATEAAARETAALKYSPVAGTLALRQGICDWYGTTSRAAAERGGAVAYAPHEVVVSSGAKQCIYQALQALCSPGDQVVIPVPFWVSYPSITKLAGAEPVFVQTTPEDGWKLQPAALAAAITPRTRVFMLTNPSNPTGAVLSHGELEAIAAVLRRPECAHVTVLADEIYSELLLEDGLDVVPFASMSGMRERTVTVNGFSKNWAMTGYRVGWLCAPAAIAKACRTYQGQVTSCACSLSMRAAVAALAVPWAEIDKNNATLRARRDRLHAQLSAVPGLKCPRTQGAFYLFADISALCGAGKQFTSSADVCLWLLEEVGVSLVPGEPFGRPGSVRVAYTASDADLDVAGRKLQEALQKLVE